MTAPDLDAIRARAEAATPGPWERSGSLVQAGRRARRARVGQTWGLAWKQDAEFIAHAREDVPALLDEVERLRGEAENWKRHAWAQGEEAAEHLDARVKAEAQVQAVRALHVDDGNGWCEGCDRYSRNCPTRDALDTGSTS
jgi:hypothetical protein